MLLAILSSSNRVPTSILDRPGATNIEQPVKPADKPAGPAVPLAK
jgi:hypothetical protein